MLTFLERKHTRQVFTNSKEPKNEGHILDASLCLQDHRYISSFVRERTHDRSGQGPTQSAHTSQNSWLKQVYSSVVDLFDTESTSMVASAQGFSSKILFLIDGSKLQRGIWLIYKYIPFTKQSPSASCASPLLKIQNSHPCQLYYNSQVKLYVFQCNVVVGKLAIQDKDLIT